MLPLACERAVLSGEVAEVTIDALMIDTSEYHFKPERLLIAGSADWELRSFVINDREQLDQMLPGQLFSSEARGGGGDRWLDTLWNGVSLRVEAIYRGARKPTNLNAGQFRAALSGVDVPPSYGPRAFSGPIRLRDVTGEPIAVSWDGPDRVLPGKSAWFFARALDRAIRVDWIILDLASEEWTIEDIAIGGKSQLRAAGSIPGEMFAPEALDTRLSLEPVPAAGNFAIKAAYRGPNKRGRFFGATGLCSTH